MSFNAYMVAAVGLQQLRNAQQAGGIHPRDRRVEVEIDFLQSSLLACVSIPGQRPDPVNNKADTNATLIETCYKPL